MHIVHKNLIAIRRLTHKNKSSNDGSKNPSYCFNMYCMSLLVNATTLEEFDTILKDATVCLTSRFFFRYVQDSYGNIKRRIDKIGSKKVNDIVDSAGDFDDTIPTDTTGESSVPASTNPFNLHFEKLLKPILNQIEGENERQPDPTVELNGSWCSQFFKFMQSYIGEMALWSGVLLGS